MNQQHMAHITMRYNREISALECRFNSEKSEIVKDAIIEEIYNRTAQYTVERDRYYQGKTFLRLEKNSSVPVKR